MLHSQYKAQWKIQSLHKPNMKLYVTTINRRDLPSILKSRHTPYVLLVLDPPLDYMLK